MWCFSSRTFSLGYIFQLREYQYASFHLYLDKSVYICYLDSCNYKMWCIAVPPFIAATKFKKLLPCKFRKARYLSWDYYSVFQRLAPTKYESLPFPVTRLEMADLAFIFSPFPFPHRLFPGSSHQLHTCFFRVRPLFWLYSLREEHCNFSASNSSFSIWNLR